MIREIFTQSSDAEEVIDKRADEVTRVVARHEKLQSEPCF